MPIGDDTYATRRHLPHLEKAGKTYFTTFATRDRCTLPPSARDITLQCCVHDHELTYWLHCAVIMPDHVHMIFTPYGLGLARIMKRIKGVSANLINKQGGSRGSVWQDESFDRIVRNDEDIWRKGEYVCANPVRAGLATVTDEYRWVWRSWIEGERDRQDCLSPTS